MDRKDYLPPSDPNSPSMRSAKAAIDMVHDFAERGTVYDLWPIDDPIRDAALCVVGAVQLKGGRTAEKALMKLPLDQKRDLVDTIRSVIEISVDKINHAGDGVHHIGRADPPKLRRRFETDEEYRDSIRSYATRSIDSYKAEIGKSADHNYGKHPINDMADVAAMAVLSDLRTMNALSEAAWINDETKELIADSAAEIIRLALDVKPTSPYEQPAVDNPNALPKMSPIEQNYVLAKEAHIIANHWDMLPETLGQRERIMGAVHDVLSMLQNGNPSVPAMQLIPIDPETDEGCVATVGRESGLIAADWNYNKPMGLKWTDPNYGHLTPENPPTSLTAQFQHIYETTRERYRTSARDLFGDPSDD